MCTGILSRGGKAIGASDYLFLVLKLRMSGVIPLLPLYAFMAQTMTTLSFLFSLPSIFHISSEIVVFVYHVYYVCICFGTT